MPSGITASIYEGKDVSLRDYLMTVGRQMGFAVMQRDDAHDAPVRPVEASDYHSKAASEASAELARLDTLTLEEAWEEAKAEYDRESARWRETKQSKESLRARYESMIAQVEGWEAPTFLASTKEHAIKYLRESIDFDCGPRGEEMRYYEFPLLVGGAEWLNVKREKARKDVKYHRDEQKKEDERTRERNEYIETFLNSLPAS